MDEKDYITVEVVGEVRVKALETGYVGLSVLGTYVKLSAYEAESLSQALENIAHDARYAGSVY